MLENYLPVLIFLIIGLAMGTIMVVLGGFVLAPNRPDKEKNSPYECGFEEFNDTYTTFDNQFFIIGIIFILFDLETIFLIPWSINLNLINIFANFSIIIFMLPLIFGFIYEFKKGALDWTL